MSDANSGLQDDLFQSAASTVESTEDETVPDSPADDEHPFDINVRAIEAGFSAFKALLDQVNALAKDHQTQWGTFAGELTIEDDELIEKHAQQILITLSQTASQSFGHCGRNIHIDAQEVVDLFWTTNRYDRDRDAVQATRDAFSPVAVWAFLKGKYQTGGRVQALREAAEALVQFLPFGGRRSGDRIRQSARAVTFDAYFGAEATAEYRRGSSEHIGPYEMSSDYLHSRYGNPTLRDNLASFATFLAWHANEDELPTEIERDLRAFDHWLQRRRGTFDLRERLVIGSVTFTLFKSKLEVAVPLALAERLNLFLAEFAADKLRERQSD